MRPQAPTSKTAVVNPEAPTCTTTVLSAYRFNLDPTETVYTSTVTATFEHSCAGCALTTARGRFFGWGPVFIPSLLSLSLSLFPFRPCRLRSFSQSLLVFQLFESSPRWPAVPSCSFAGPHNQNHDHAACDHFNHSPLLAHANCSAVWISTPNVVKPIVRRVVLDFSASVVRTSVAHAWVLWVVVWLQTLLGPEMTQLLMTGFLDKSGPRLGLRDRLCLFSALESSFRARVFREAELLSKV